MVRKTSIAVLLSISLIFCLIHISSAYDMSVTVKTLPNVSVTLNVLNPETLDSIFSFINDTNLQGEFKWIFSVSNSFVSFSTIIRNNGKIIKNQRFGNYSSGADIVLDLLDAPKKTAPINNSQTNMPSSNSTNSSMNTGIASQATNKTNASNISGNSFSDSLKSIKISNTLIYIIAGIVLLAGLIFLLMKFIFPLFDRKDEIDEEVLKSPHLDKELEEAERKIKQAQEEIDMIKNRRRKLTEAERKFEEAKRELERLKR